MRYLIKAELNRLISTKLIWALVIIYFILSLLNGALTGITTGNADWLVEIKDAFFMAAEDNGIALKSVIDIMENLMSTNQVSTFNSFVQANVSSNLMLMISIFVGFFLLAQKSSGYIKNMIPLRSRNEVLFSNIISLALFTAVLDIIYLIAMGIMWNIFFQESGIDGNTLWYLFVLFIITILNALFIYSICDMFKNPKVGMIIAVIYTAGFSKYMYKIVDIILQAAQINTKIEMFLPLGILSAINATEIKTVLIGGIFAVIYGAAAFFYLYRNSQRRDY